MKLKQKINKDIYDKLTEERKALYVEKDDGYVLDVEIDDADDVGKLKRAKDREVAAAKEYRAKAEELQAKLDELTGNDAKRRGDIETLEKAWKEKTEKQVNELSAKLENKDNFIAKTLVDAKAAQLAAKLCGDKATLILPHIKARLLVDLDGDEPMTKILDAAGKLSALDLGDLEKEFIANKDFSSIIIGSKANGSGAAKDGKQQGQGSAPLNANGQPKSLREMNVTEKVDYMKQQKADQAASKGN
jgi:hypothetical protein